MNKGVDYRRIDSPWAAPARLTAHFQVFSFRFKTASVLDLTITLLMSSASLSINKELRFQPAT